MGTPVVIVRKASPTKKTKQNENNNKNPLEIGGTRKEIDEKSPRQTPSRTRPAPMRYKYDAPPGFNEAYGKYTPRNRSNVTPARRIIKKKQEAQHVGPSGADPSLSPYRGDYGSVVTEDAFGARPRSPVTSPAWEEGITAFDGEFDTLQNVFHDRQRALDDEEVESLNTPVPAKPQPGGGGGKAKSAPKKGGKKK